MIRLLFLIRRLGRGGAERQLTQLVRGLDKSRFAITVVTQYDGGDFAAEMKAIEGVELLSLQKKSRWDFRSVIRFWRTLRRAKPQIVHGYMGASNELCLLLGKSVGARVVWGLRASRVNFADYEWGAVAAPLSRVGAWLSQFADLIIINSQAGKEHYLSDGYAKERMVVIRNGIDTERWHPDREAGARMRKGWRISEADKLIGLVGRLDPMKGHPIFLRAAALLCRHRADVRFACAGGGGAAYRRKMQAFGTGLGLDGRLLWAGECRDMLAVYNALDISTSASSYGEGFSNAIGESMACGVPCVVTDIGDSPLIVGNDQQVTPRDDPDALVRAWVRILDLPEEQRAALSKKTRERIVTEFSVEKLVTETESNLLRLLS